MTSRCVSEQTGTEVGSGVIEFVDPRPPRDNNEAAASGRWNAIPDGRFQKSLHERLGELRARRTVSIRSSIPRASAAEPALRIRDRYRRAFPELAS